MYVTLLSYGYKTAEPLQVFSLLPTDLGCGNIFEEKGGNK